MPELFFQNRRSKTDEELKAIMAELQTGSDKRRHALVEVLKNGRRLKALFAPERLNTNEKQTPALTIENISSMTDYEIEEGWRKMDDLPGADLLIALLTLKDDDPTKIRVGKIIPLSATPIDEDEKEAKEEELEEGGGAEEEETDEEESEDEEEKAPTPATPAPINATPATPPPAGSAEFQHASTALAAPAQAMSRNETAGYTMRDDKALAYIRAQIDGGFKSPADIRALITDDEQIQNMVNGKMLPIDDARVIQLCFITDKQTAERLAHALGDIPHKLTATLRYLEEREAKDKIRAKNEQKTTEEALGDLNTAATPLDVAKLLDGVEELGRKRRNGNATEADIVRYKVLKNSVYVKQTEVGNQFRQGVHGFNKEQVTSEIARYEGLLAETKEKNRSDHTIQTLDFCLRVLKTHLEWLSQHPNLTPLDSARPKSNSRHG